MPQPIAEIFIKNRPLDIVLMLAVLLFVALGMYIIFRVIRAKWTGVGMSTSRTGSQSTVRKYGGVAVIGIPMLIIGWKYATDVILCSPAQCNPTGFSFGMFFFGFPVLVVAIPVGLWLFRK